MKYDEVADTTTYYYYNAFEQVLAEYEEPTDQSAKLARTFVYGNGIDEVLAMYLPERDYDPNNVIRLMAFCDTWLADSGDGNYNSDYDYDNSGVVDFNDFAVLADDNWSLPQQANETRFYYLHDALGSVIGLVGARFQRESDREFYLYDVYGATSDLSAAQNPYLFTGRRLDILASGSLKIYNYRARTYNPATGRFLQTDPIGYYDSMNLYEYVYNNPTNWIDPLGLVPWWEEVWIYTKVTFIHLPGAYWETAMSGEQFSGLLGYSDGITGALNPFGEGTHFGVYERYREAYGTGKTVGGAGGFTMNMVLLVSGVRGTVTAVSTIQTTGGALQVAQVATSTGQAVKVVMVNGQAVVATMEGLLNAGLSAAAAKNLLNQIEGEGGTCKSETQQAKHAKDVEKGNLRERMGDPPKDMKKPEAHHDLPQKFADKFRKAGLDTNDPRYGRWVEGGPYGNHQKWSKAFNDQWGEFFKNHPKPTQRQILAKINELRKNPKFK